jgi:predicted permease
VLSAFVLPGDIALANITLTPNVRVLAFTALLGLVTAALFGVMPSLRASRADLIERLRMPATAGRGIRAWLVGAQVGLSLTLLVGAALFVETMRAALTADIGFDPRPLAAITVNPSLAAGDPANARGYYGRVLDAAAGIPGVTGAALSTHLPLGPLDDVRPFAAEPSLPNASEVNAGFNAVSDGYFHVLGDPLIDGRPFGATDDERAPPVAIVNETAAQLFAPNGRPLGREIVHANMLRYTIVGVVRDTKYASVRDQHVPMVFVPIAQDGGGDVNVIVRSADPKAALGALGRVLRSLPPHPPQREARLVADQIGAMLMPQRFGATLLGVFSLIALAISAVGIYGGVSYAVNRQRREIGIRIALGARAADVAHLVATRVAMVVACGIVAGLAGAALTSRALDRFLYGVTPLDPAAFLAATLVMSVAAAVAFAIPLVRAIRIDPTKAIRND